MLGLEGGDSFECIDMVMMGGELGYGLALVGCNSIVMKLEMIVMMNTLV